ncbi:MAG: hypothetical protein EYC69_14270 [Bacteroidetes bacterium]|nr:MAG: hypothetical protein EYC69_14270 [Bacteroidota bacterium]
MKDQHNSRNILFLAMGLILFAALTRLLPHPYNFTALGAMALFSGVTFGKHKWAYLLPFIVLILTDLILGLHVSMIPVYACIALTVFLGTRVQNKPGILNIAILSLTSSSIFFLITNLPIWYADLSLYPMTIAGTLESYSMAIPFFKNQILGDLFYNTLLFGIYHSFAKSRKVVLS